MTALWAQRAAEHFWEDAGGDPGLYPRDLRRAVAFALPLGVVDVPSLGVHNLTAWLGARGIALDQPLLARDVLCDQPRPHDVSHPRRRGVLRG